MYPELRSSHVGSGGRVDAASEGGRMKKTVRYARIEAVRYEFTEYDIKAALVEKYGIELADEYSLDIDGAVLTVRYISDGNETNTGGNESGD